MASDYMWFLSNRNIDLLSALDVLNATRFVDVSFVACFFFTMRGIVECLT